MKYKLLCFLLVVSSCKEITDFYTEGYRFRYSRPIGLMMSPTFDALNLSGKGISIGVIDAGFGNFRANEYTKNLKVNAFKDFTTTQTDSLAFFSDEESDHGTIVVKSIGGRNAEDKVHGLAYQAAYYLAKTDLLLEEPAEDEARLLQAIDWLIGQEVRLINISLGYTTFDDQSPYSNKDLNGKIALSSRFLHRILGQYPELIVVVSAGNEGDSDWQHLTFPGDVYEAITVGSTDFDGVSRYYSSGTGPDYTGFVKPEVCTYPTPPGNSNTAPVITGLIATLLEAKALNRQEVRQLLFQSCSNYANPNNEIGYGVPDTQKIITQLNQL